MLPKLKGKININPFYPSVKKQDMVASSLSLTKTLPPTTMTIYSLFNEINPDDWLNDLLLPTDDTGDT